MAARKSRSESWAGQRRPIYLREGRLLRLPYNLGHAAFDFIQFEYGKAGIRRFLVALRANLVDGGRDPYETAFGTTVADFQHAFEGYLKDRFVS